MQVLITAMTDTVTTMKMLLTTNKLMKLMHDVMVIER